MRFQNLDDWLRWQERLNPRLMDLGLERVGRVWERLHSGPLPFAVVTVAGTNGKGSCVALVESLLRAGGYAVGAYTSPHLLRYNERVRIRGDEVHDEAFCRAFEKVEQARGEVALTYFEFGTLAALVLFLEAELDAVILEVGLGGRLDAVNVVDPDVAVVTSVGIDHVDWLGPDREAIGREKAGIFRNRVPAICADPAPPASVAGYAAEVGAALLQLGAEFRYRRVNGGWCWEGPGRRYAQLPLPGLAGAVQLQNAAAALAALEQLRPRLALSEEQIRQGLSGAALPGRYQKLTGAVERILDVAHNPDGARALAGNLAAEPVGGATRAVIAMLTTKDVAATVRPLIPLVDAWHAAGLDAERGYSAEALAGQLAAAGARGPVAAHTTVAAACAAAMAEARPGDRVVVLGSFHTVGAALAAWGR